MKKRPRRKAKPPPRSPGVSRGPRGPRAGRARGSALAPTVRGPLPLQFKVVELSTVDEGTLERTLNEWTPKGWAFEGVQFAMRESSKRPAMAFVFFTREGVVDTSDVRAARDRLLRLSDQGSLPGALGDEPVRETPALRSLSLEPEE
jgi:hypothetical protein